jgi:hypothetical protein
MLALLNKILCAITNLAWHVADLLVLLVNKLLAALVIALAAVLGLFPPLPDLPGTPAGAVLQWVNWLFPVAGILALFSTYVALYVIARVFMAAVRLLEKVGVKP